MVEQQERAAPWILSLDLGANSLGWAALRMGSDGEPCGLLHHPDDMAEHPSLGVRIFDEGVENYGQGEREQSRAVARRQARLQRRQSMRRARRMTKTFHILQRAGLLPEFGPGQIDACGGPDAARDALLKGLDAQIAPEIRHRLPVEEQSRISELLPYALRSHALNAPFPPYWIGRALYHLAQRRGFLSNRKSDTKEDERSTVKAGIRALEQGIAGEGSASTLGRYLYRSGLRGERLRRRWTSRSMYEQEFEALWTAQQRYAPAMLVDDVKRALHSALFHQRPLKDQRHLIGVCEFENGSEYVDEKGEIRRTRGRRRAPECLVLSQRFKVWQTVNNVRVRDPQGDERELSLEEKQRLARDLETRESMGIKEVKAALGLAARNKLNFQAAGSRELKGNRTNAQLQRLLGDRWTHLDPDIQEAVIWEIWNAEDNRALIGRARSRMGIWKRVEPSQDEAEALDHLVIGGNYMALSSAAMKKLLPYLQRGMPYARAVQSAYGSRIAMEACQRLPPVVEVFQELRNPAVSRALTELRRVVNTLVREYGKPESIRIELARDLKQGKEERKKRQDDGRRNEVVRSEAKARILRDRGVANPTGEDILRMRLYEECAGQCPYSGKQISMAELFGGQVDIEHIVPFSRSLDDSFTNRTLCLAEVNRNEKGNRTPFEAFGHDSDRWAEMAGRMRAHVDARRMSEGKLRRFLLTAEELEEFLEGFRSSQLNDTRFASRWAREYLTRLYGGDLGRGVDAAGVTRVQVGNGSVTALIRRALGIDRLLPTPPGEKRNDHRHHAVDALAIALTSPSIVQRLSRDADEEWETRRRRIKALPYPWQGFVDDVRGSVDRIVISFRIDNRVRGPLHKETIYSPRRGEDGARVSDGPVTHVRKPVEALTTNELDAIVDNRVRTAVASFLNGRDPKKVCLKGKPETYPFLMSKDGRRIPVLRVRLKKRNTTRVVGGNGRQRSVENAENHHLVVRDTVDARGRKRVAYELVSLFDACQRRAAGKPIVARDVATRFTLARNDVVEILDEEGTRRLCRVLSITEAEFEGCWAYDARTEKIRKRTGDRVRIGPAKLSAGLECRKIVVSPIGVVRPCRA